MIRRTEDVAHPPTSGRACYAYSFDRETFRGRFATRRDAVAAAEVALEERTAATDTIWVGRRVEARPPTAAMGQVVTKELRRRQSEAGEVPAAVTPDAIEDLNRRLEALLGEWLADHNLLPEARIEEISEHPVPLVSHVADSGQQEVQLIGVEG